MRSLVGYTGFVGSNLAKGKRFGGCYNSVNIKEAFSTKPDILYYAGVPAQKYLANMDPEKDIDTIEEAMNNISRIMPKSVVLISTVDVYSSPHGVDENTIINLESLEAYGKHRFVLEQFVRNNYRDHTIIRLPGLFGKNIKKNFIYDMIHFIPSALSAVKIADLDFSLLHQYYLPSDNGFYRLRDISQQERGILNRYFTDVGFSALSFTDSRSKFQFYNLSSLYEQIEVARSFGIRLLNVATEPCEAGELYKYIFRSDFTNILPQTPPDYDMRTVYANILGGEHGYIAAKDRILKEIKAFVLSSRNKLNIG